MEWTSPYNPFNSLKVLMWREWLEGCAKGNVLPPITVDTDPTNICNFNCIWCNAFDMMNNESRRKTMSAKHLIRLADFYYLWGVRSTCIAGGGEPLLNKNLPEFLERLNYLGIEAGIITNGSLLNGLEDVIAKTCRWVGISMDAGSSVTYNKVKGIKDPDMFGTVCNNIEDLTDRIKSIGSNCEVTYKYLMHPENVTDISLAAVMAEVLGCQSIHVRPVGWDNLTITDSKAPIDMKSLVDEIDYQCEAGRMLENKNFKFFGIRHKFNPDMRRKVNFKSCKASPMILTFGADGNCHLCFDRRGDKDLILCSHYPRPANVLNHWNSERHHKILRDIDVNKCPRCTFGPYNEIIDQVFTKDSMCRYFP